MYVILYVDANDLQSCKAESVRQIKLLSPKRKEIDSEQRKRVVGKSNPTSMMATRHEVTYLHNMRQCSMVDGREQIDLPPNT